MTLGTSRIGVRIERFGDKRKHMYKLTEDSLCMVKAGTSIIPLYQVATNAVLYDQDGKEQINAEGTFYITAETFDPYHIVLDIFD